MNVEIGTETPIFLFWEYLFRNFGILSLQCTGIGQVFFVLVVYSKNIRYCIRFDLRAVLNQAKRLDICKMAM